MKSDVWSTDELTSITNADRLLPSQPYFSKFYKGPENEFFKRMEETILSMQPCKSIDQAFDINLKPEVTYACLGSELSTLSFYQMLIRMNGYKTVLELGTFIGVSALFFAEAIGDGGKVTTVELGKEFYDIAEGNLARNGYAERVDQVLGCALETLKSYASEGKKFDMIFMDAGKENYDEMFFPALSCLSDRGLLLVDDVFFQGEVFNYGAMSPKGLGVKRLLEKAAILDGYQKVLLPIGNGLLMVRRDAI